ncbi:hypothetical protein [Dysgonomonas macrotermitis]|uniref:Uncharacterized protein n=1 Tax=Dysgonomonas macrotermitis TaxID=1346286 RepID=A0A1M4SLP7_9BACT|nr:hypothetical protein [Dysgonomonas macrotermitis]SHE33126.1 hypothetical protein SAMN05444362_10196 [Dysgonomonas macrotermitis]
MKKIKWILLLVFIVTTTVSCEMVSNMFTYRSVSVAFLKNLMEEEYDKALDEMAVDKEILGSAKLDTLKLELADFRYYIAKQFGTELDYTFLKTEKVRSTIESNNTPAGTTDVYIQFSNDNYFGVFKFSFDDKSGKILFVNALDIKKVIPSMFSFWIRGLIAVLIPIFNIYVIIQIRRSNLKRKWLKYIAVICLNIPSITYSAVNGYSFGLLQFQLFFGFGFSLTGYLNCAWTIGIPIGGLYWLWRLNERKRLKNEPDTAYTEDIE